VFFIFRSNPKRHAQYLTPDGRNQDQSSRVAWLNHGTTSRIKGIDAGPERFSSGQMGRDWESAKILGHYGKKATPAGPMRLLRCGPEPVARIPAKWNHFAEKDSRQYIGANPYRQSLQLWRDVIYSR
jgi:hypothetical protein